MSSEVKQLASFRAKFHENPHRSIAEEYFEWKLLKNPYLKGHIYIESKDDKVVGASSITPKRVSVLGQPALAGELGDAFTATHFRRKGVFARGMQSGIDYALEHDVSVIYGTTPHGGPSSLGLQKKLNCKICSSVSMRYMSKPLRPLKPFAKSALNAVFKKKVRSSERFHTLSRQVFNSHKTSTADAQSLTVSPVESFNNEIDGLWGQKRYAFCVLRDRIYLNWRFFENPDSYILLVAQRDNECLGYLAAKISRDKKTAVICDYITHDDNMHVFRLLLAEIEKILKQQKVHQLTTYCVHNSPYFRVFEEIFYFDHGLERSFSTVLFWGTELGKQLYSTQQPWHFTLADTDNI